MTERNSSYQISFFAALCLFLSAVEYAIPKPLPFLRLGLANLPILIAVKKMRPRDVLILILLKIAGQAFISGTLFSYIFVFSAAGSFASGLTMLGLYRFCFLCEKRHNGKFLISDIGLSVAGALANNAAQLVCAKYIMFGDNTRYIAPILLVAGFITGLALGIFAYLFEAKSVFYGTRLNTSSDNEQFDTPIATVNQPKNSKSDTIWFVCSLVVMCCFLFIKNLIILWVSVIILYICTLIRKRGKVKILPSLIITITVTFFALLSPYGKVLFSIGFWRITKDALFTGLHRSGILVGMVFVSQCAVTKNLKLPGKAGKFLSEMFSVFEELTAKRISFKPGTIISSIDERLCEIYEG